MDDWKNENLPEVEAELQMIKTVMDDLNRTHKNLLKQDDPDEMKKFRSRSMEICIGGRRRCRIARSPDYSLTM